MTKAKRIAREVKERMLVEMENVWPQNFWTGYVASMCNIREKQLLFLTDTSKRNRAVTEFKAAVLECCKRHAVRADAALANSNANAQPVSEQKASAPAVDQNAPAPMQAREKLNAPDPVRQLFDFNPLKPRDAEKQFKERLMKRQAEEDRQSEEHINDPAVKLEHEIDEEVARYLRVSQQENADPLVWWRENQKDFPHTALLARTMLAVPASSAGAERVFKSLSLTLSQRRRRLRDRFAESIVFIHENRQHYAPKVWALEQKRHKEAEQRKAKEADDPDGSVES